MSHLSPTETVVLRIIQTKRGIKRIDIHAQLRNTTLIPRIDLHTLKMILAELMARGEIIEIEYKYEGVLDFFYIPGPADLKVRGRGI